MATYDPGQANYNFNQAFQTKFGRTPTSSESSQFGGNFDWSQPLSQSQYDQGMNWINSYSPTPATGTPSTPSTPSGGGTLGPAASGNQPAPYQGGTGSWDFYNRWQTRFGRQPTAQEISQFTAANPINFSGTITQPEYDKAMAWINAYGGGTGTGGTTPGGTGTGGYSPTTPNVGAAPGFTAPRPDLPSYTAPDPFSYPDFQAPTWEQMKASDPGIQARFERGQQALEHSASARGALHSPNTMAGLIDWNQDTAAQEYGNAYNRAFNQWKTGFDTAASTYDRNYDVGAETFARNYQRAMDQYQGNLTGAQLEYAPGFATWQQQNRWGELGYDRAWQNYLTQLDDAYRRETRDQQRYDTRDFYERDDLWRRYQLEENRRLRLAEMGMT